VYQLEAKDEAANPQTAENNGNLNRTAFVGIAATLGMDQGKFASCFDSGKYAVQIQQESSQAQAYGINATPSFIINGQQVVGAQPLSAFQAVIDPLLKS
jgi:predicted DsbA family dithiol-disulfide isomerase